jgi:hypothetical protein
VVESGGISFLAERRWLPLVSGIRVEVESFQGREGLVAFHPATGGC